MNSTVEIFTEIIHDVSNFFDNFWMFLYEWGLPLITAIGGAVITLVARELVDWYKRPKLKIDFGTRGKIQPYITDVNDFIAASKGTSNGIYRIIYFRLKVHNKGRKAALNCEAKLELNIINGDRESSNQKIFHKYV